MILIPLPYLIAAFALFCIYLEISNFEREQRNPFLMAFLAVLAIQATIIGTRFGYDVHILGRIQPLFAAMMPPLAYLTFAETKMPTRMLHALPVLIIIAVAIFTLNWLDTFLSINNLSYATALVLIGLRGTDGLTNVPINRAGQMQKLLWLAVASLLLSGFADGIIAYDFWTSGGENIKPIVGAVSAIGLIGSAVAIWHFKKTEGPTSERSNPETTEHDSMVFERIETLMKTDRLFLEPELNLKRIARRLTLPVRDVSRAINAEANCNVSQYVNMLRVKEACRLMQDPKTSVTETIYAAGFNTKSNFNREFVRITGKTPSQWRVDLRN